MLDPKSFFRDNGFALRALPRFIHIGILSDSMHLGIGISLKKKGDDYINLLNRSHVERLLLIIKLYLSLSF